MKNKLNLVLIVLVISAIKPANAQNKAFKNGTIINLIFGNPSPNNYGIKGHHSKIENGNLVGFEIGNRWYFKHNEKYGIGLMVNWGDASFHSSYIGMDNVDSTLNYSLVLNIAFFEGGPIGTYALTSNIRMDAYYNMRPTYMLAGQVPYEYVNGEGITEKGYYSSYATGFGLTHTMGFSFRWRVLALSFEYLYGNLREVDGGLFQYGDNNISANHLRFMVGVKF